MQAFESSSVNLTQLYFFQRNSQAKLLSSGIASPIGGGLRHLVRVPFIKLNSKPIDSSNASLADARLRSVRALRVSLP